MANESVTLHQISERIRELRTDKKITLKELSSITGLSVSFLSQVERGASSLAIPSLEKIAGALDVPITDFFSNINKDRYVVRKEEHKVIQTEKSQAGFISFAGEFQDRKLDPLMVILRPLQNDGRVYRHPGEEFYYVQEGEAVVTIDGEEYHLKQGDSIHFPSEKPHSFRNPLSAETRLLYIVTPLIF